MKTNIVLIGFMATGKTSVAKLLAKKLEKKYVSTDECIEKNIKKSIPKIFEEDGEIKFREIEIETIKKVSKMNNTIVDCGGGAVLNWINIARLKENGTIILLRSSVEKTLQRSSLNTNRPLLKVENKRKKIIELLKFREPFYKRAADMSIDTTNSNINNVITKILRILKKKGVLNGCCNQKRAN